MPRARYRDTAMFRTGGQLFTVSGAIVTLYEPETNLLLAQTIYTTNDVTNMTAKANPFTAEDDGTILFYLNNPQRVKIKVDGAPVGLGTTTIDLEPVYSDPSDYIVAGGTIDLTDTTFLGPTVIGMIFNGPRTFSVSSEGSVNQTENASPLIDAVIAKADAAQDALQGNPAKEIGVEVIFDKPIYCVDQVKIHNKANMKIIGASNKVKLVANKQTVARPVIEMVASPACSVEYFDVYGIQAHGNAEAPAVIPQAAILISGSALAPAAQTKGRTNTLGSLGHFSIASMVLYNCTDGEYNFSAFQNYMCRYGLYLGEVKPTDVDGNPLVSSIPGGLAAAGNTGSGNHTFNTYEYHVMPLSGGYFPVVSNDPNFFHTAKSGGMCIVGSLGALFNGGNIGCYGLTFIELGNGTKNLVFNRLQMYTDDDAAGYSWNNNDTYVHRAKYGVLLQSNASVDGVIFNAPQFNSSPATDITGHSIFRFAPGSVMKGLHYNAPAYASINKPVLISAGGGYAADTTKCIIDSVIDCTFADGTGMDIALDTGTPGPSIDARSRLINPGNITKNSGARVDAIQLSDAGTTFPVGIGTAVMTASTVTASGDLSGKHVRGSGSAPTPTKGAGWGTDSTISCVGSDSGCRVRVAAAGTGRVNNTTTWVNIAYNSTWGSNAPLWQLSLRVVDDINFHGASFLVLEDTGTNLKVQVVFPGVNVPLAGNSYDLVFSMIGRPS